MSHDDEGSRSSRPSSAGPFVLDDIAERLDALSASASATYAALVRIEEYERKSAEFRATILTFLEEFLSNPMVGGMLPPEALTVIRALKSS